MLSAVRQAHCELSAVRQDFGVQFDKLTVRAVPEPFDKLKVRPAEGQSNAHCELSAEETYLENREWGVGSREWGVR